jgi:hypothetical protein
VNALQSAINTKANITYVDSAISNLVNSSPETLNTLSELATALGNDPNYATTVSTQIGLKADKSYVDSANTTLQTQITSLSTNKANVSYVDTQDTNLQNNINALSTTVNSQLTSLQSLKADTSYVDSNTSAYKPV